jgi:hypothetical protein
MSACGIKVSDPIQMTGKEALSVDWSLYPGLCDLITQNQLILINRLMGSSTKMETQCLQDCHISDCGCGDFTATHTLNEITLRGSLKELIIVRENYFNRSSIRENFTTSICREWSNYIFLCDRNTLISSAHA